MPLTVLLDLHLKPDNLDSAHADIHTILVDTRAFAGCLGVEVLVGAKDRAHVLLVERWASAEHDAVYRAWRAGEGATNLGGLLAAAPTVSMFETAEDI